MSYVAEMVSRSASSVSRINTSILFKAWMLAGGVRTRESVSISL